MILYSKTIESFLLKVYQVTRHILNHEMNLPCKRSRFYHKGVYYPLSIVVFEGRKDLGFFDQQLYQIGLNKCLMYQAKESVLADVIRHELAHYYHWLTFGHIDEAHGPAFKAICRQFQWNDSVGMATLNLSDANDQIMGDLEQEKLLGKIKKLLQLASSSNTHEAMLATVKANQLLLKHNLERLELLDENHETLCVHRVFSQTRKTPFMVCLYEILGTFLVRPVFNYGKGIVYMEVTGSRANVELAEYVTEFLKHQLPSEWDKVKSSLTRTVHHRTALNSFYRGVAKGYLAKIEEQKKELSPSEQKGLIVIEKNLDGHIRNFYHRLSSTQSRESTDEESFHIGKKVGRDLSIRPGVKSNGERLLLT